MSNNTGVPADLAVEKVLADLKGFRAFLTGSSAAAIAHDKPMAYTDIDVFAPQPGCVLHRHPATQGSGVPGCERALRADIGTGRWTSGSTAGTRTA